MPASREPQMPAPIALYALANVADFTAAAAERGGLVRFASAADATSANRHAAPEDRARFLAARAMARLLSTRLLGLAPIEAAALPAAVAACRSCGGPHGKPGLRGVSVNWSRSGAWVMAAAGHPAAGRLGVDIERIPARLFAGFDAQCLSSAEQAALEPSDVGGRMGLWVAKEALLKACGHGLSIPPAAVRVAPDPGIDAGVAAGADPRALDGLSVRGMPAPEGYAAAIACGQPLPVVPVPSAQLFGG